MELSRHRIAFVLIVLPYIVNLFVKADGYAAAPNCCNIVCCCPGCGNNCGRYPPIGYAGDCSCTSCTRRSGSLPLPPEDYNSLLPNVYGLPSPFYERSAAYNRYPHYPHASDQYLTRPKEFFPYLSAPSYLSNIPIRASAEFPCFPFDSCQNTSPPVVTITPQQNVSSTTILPPSNASTILPPKPSQYHNFPPYSSQPPFPFGGNLPIGPISPDVNSNYQLRPPFSPRGPSVLASVIPIPIPIMQQPNFGWNGMPGGIPAIPFNPGWGIGRNGPIFPAPWPSSNSTTQSPIGDIPFRDILRLLQITTTTTQKPTRSIPPIPSAGYLPPRNLTVAPLSYVTSKPAGYATSQSVYVQPPSIYVTSSYATSAPQTYAQPQYAVQPTQTPVYQTAPHSQYAPPIQSYNVPSVSYTHPKAYNQQSQLPTPFVPGVPLVNKPQPIASVPAQSYQQPYIGSVLPIPAKPSQIAQPQYGHVQNQLSLYSMSFADHLQPRFYGAQTFPLSVSQSHQIENRPTVGFVPGKISWQPSGAYSSAPIPFYPPQSSYVPGPGQQPYVSPVVPYASAIPPKYTTSPPKYPSPAPVSYVTSTPIKPTLAPTYATPAPSYVTPAAGYASTPPKYATPVPGYASPAVPYVSRPLPIPDIPYRPAPFPFPSIPANHGWGLVLFIVCIILLILLCALLAALLFYLNGRRDQNRRYQTTVQPVATPSRVTVNQSPTQP
ncbi:hypothetical protein M3Y98_00197500 [Aphelenchoides besseyi]|nr:hypothetical protein M3Y98_00197500 [Aphelenchoides besseyi]